MIKQLDIHIPELESMKKYPTGISYRGNHNLLKNQGFNSLQNHELAK